MLAVQMTMEEALEEIEESGMKGKVVAACVNSPNSITLSGDLDGIEFIQARLKSEKKFARLLNTGGQAYHSHHLSHIGIKYVARLEAVLGEVHKPADGIRFISTMTNQLVDTPLGAQYWRGNAESPVLFSPGVKTLLDGHDFHLVEIGPHSALAMPIKQIVQDMDVPATAFAYFSALTRGKNGAECLVKLAGELFLAGHEVDFAAVNEFDPKHSMAAVSKLPSYPWHYEEPLANESRWSKEFRSRRHRRHDLLGSEEVGGSKRDRTWRNFLNVKDVPWLQDHRLGQTVVFPAAGYCVMAIEAVNQAKSDSDKKISSFNLSRVKISKPLILSTDCTDKGSEVFTVLRPSGKAWHFEISSVKSGMPTLHAEGDIAISFGTHKTTSTLRQMIPTSESRQMTKDNFYRRLREQGLTFGETFQSISDIFAFPGTGPSLYSSSKTVMAREQSGAFKDESDYTLHPITIDALLQSTIGATCQGHLQTLKASVPTYLGSVRINVNDQGIIQQGQYSILAKATAYEFCPMQVEADLVDSEDTLIARISDVRLTPFNGGQIEEKVTTRCPIQKITWKPDLALNSEMQLCKAGFNEGQELQGILDLLCHKNPNLDLLQLDLDQHDTDLSSLLTQGSMLQPFTSFTRGRLTPTGKVHSVRDSVPNDDDDDDDDTTPQDLLEHNFFDFIVIPNFDTSLVFFEKLSLNDLPESIQKSSFLAVVPARSNWTLPGGSSHEVSFTIPTTDGSVIMVSPKHEAILRSPTSNNIILIETETAPFLNDLFAEALVRSGLSVERQSLHSLNYISLPFRSTVISLAELAKPVLKDANSAQIKAIQKMLSRSSRLLWLTGGGVLQGQNPDFALVQGLARTVRLEQPDTDLFTLDICLDSLDSFDVATCTAQILSILRQDASRFPIDYEFAAKDDTLYISRLKSDDLRSSIWRQKEGLEEATRSLRDLKYERLTMTSSGRPDSLRFVENAQPNEVLGSKMVELCLQTAGLASRNIAALQGKANSPSELPLTQYTGIIKSVGDEVSGLEIGDRVLVMAPSDLRRYLRVPAASCHKLLASEDSKSMCSMPIPFVKALHAIRDRLAIQPQETILIHWNGDHIGSASIEVAKALGAKVYVVMERASDKDVVINTCGMSEATVSAFDDSDMIQKIDRFSNGKGINTLLTPQARLLPGDVWATLDTFCRCALIGTQESVMTQLHTVLPGNATVTYVNLDAYLQTTSVHYQQKLQEMFSDVLNLYRANHLSMSAIETVVDISDLTTVLAKLPRDEVNKSFVLSLENEESQLEISSLRYAVTLDAEKTYLLIGCLGGLGRALSKWMLQRGARKFVFMGRSGTDRKPARRLVEELVSSVAQVDVVRGDVLSAADVNEAVRAAKSPIGGVVQAAMGLDESVFSNMTPTAWHQGIDPKVTGTWNLHQSLQSAGSIPDFFLLFSSLNGSVGAYTESNYCAANAFLDAFARFRRSQGLPCVAIGLGAMSEIGYVADNPEIEAHFVRRGIRPLLESEFLQMIDIALTTSSNSAAESYDPLSETHILTGLEPFDSETLAALGKEQKNPVEGDPRALLWSKAYAVDNGAEEKSDELATIMKAISAAGENPSANAATEILKAITPMIAKGLSDLIVRPVNQIEISKPLATYGMDSMLAAEFRTWFYRTFHVDVPLMDILSSSGSIRSLSQIIYDGLISHLQNLEPVV